MEIVRCPSCDGFGWSEDELSGETEDCSWCGGIGYVYQQNGIDQKIPLADTEKAEVAQKLESMEAERMREIGYSGEAKKPWEQAFRKGTKGGLNPYE